ncbi:hypothetical protein IEQ34_020137 [Dendrobium chrysotoxum]|uniref:Uncharacterized protein n=1 Tax=Dendrobium chrysotoxum TaxID=161865 RepID=A0AAV7FKE7_DENCH|nr:hypothetical protein IEQ34_020137 [Dendrobium chrysotoxum]
MPIGSYNQSEFMQGKSSMLSPSSSQSDDIEFSEEGATSACLIRTGSGKEAAAFPRSNREVMMAIKSGANAPAKSALTTASVVKALPEVTVVAGDGGGGGRQWRSKVVVDGGGHRWLPVVVEVVADGGGQSWWPAVAVKGGGRRWLEVVIGGGGSGGRRWPEVVAGGGRGGGRWDDPILTSGNIVIMRADIDQLITNDYLDNEHVDAFANKF